METISIENIESSIKEMENAVTQSELSIAFAKLQRKSIDYYENKLRYLNGRT